MAEAFIYRRGTTVGNGWLEPLLLPLPRGVTASQGSAITINLVGNYISASGGNHLNADLTGDGHPDLTIANASNSVHVPTTYFTAFNARVNLNGVLAAAFRRNHGNPSTGFEILGSRSTTFLRSGNPGSSFYVFNGTYNLTGSIPLFFKDLHINGGAPTRGLLQITVSTGAGDENPHGSAEIQLDSFTYASDTPGERPSVVPDQGSSLTLLAMGAGGVLALRRWRAAQGRS